MKNTSATRSLFTGNIAMEMESSFGPKSSTTCFTCYSSFALPEAHKVPAEQEARNRDRQASSEAHHFPLIYLACLRKVNVLARNEHLCRRLSCFLAWSSFVRSHPRAPILLARPGCCPLRTQTCNPTSVSAFKVSLAIENVKPHTTSQKTSHPRFYSSGPLLKGPRWCPGT